jgi:hypothetical protein
MEKEKKKEMKIVKFDSPEIFLGFYIEHYKNCRVLDLNC